MAKNTSFVLGDHFDRFLEAQLRSGRYQNASEVVRASLRLLEEQEAHRAHIRSALAVGEASGSPRAVDRVAFVKKLQKRPRPSV